MTTTVLGTCAMSLAQYQSFVSTTGQRVPVNVIYQNSTEDFDATLAGALVGAGVGTLIVTVEAWRRLSEIASGVKDSAFTRIAGQMKAFLNQHAGQADIVMRPLHEANGNWYDWCFGGGHNGNNMADFVPAWMRIRSVVRAVDPRIEMGWSPYIVPSTAPYELAQWYPGNDNVERILPDGYNRSQSDGGWRSPTNVWGRTLDEVRSFVSIDKPIILAETATSEPSAQSAKNGHSKAEWLGQLGQWMKITGPGYNVTGACYFNYDKSTVNGNDWRIETDPANGAALSQALV